MGGKEACEKAHIVSGNEAKGGIVDEVVCSGNKACRKVHIEGAGLVMCQNEVEGQLACMGFATIETVCFYCGKNGCAADSVNQCRYKLDSGGDESSYKKCKPETIQGVDCPSWEELNSEIVMLHESELVAVTDLDRVDI